MDSSKIAENLEKELPEIIKKIAFDNEIKEYYENPDLLEERLKSWHQFGLVSHTKKVRKVYLQELNKILEKWGLASTINEKLMEKIEGIDKGILFDISIIFHDLGKIICLKDKKTNREHEILSKELISKYFLKEKLIKSALTEPQIDYIKRCVETHDILGKNLRDELKHRNMLNIDLFEKEEIKDMCRDLAKKYSEVRTEIGIFFVCDTLGKTSIRTYLKNEEEIEKILEKNGLSKDLKKAVIQLPISLKLAEVYLKSLV